METNGRRAREEYQEGNHNHTILYEKVKKNQFSIKKQ